MSSDIGAPASPPAPVTLRELVARNLLRLRLDAGISIDHVATAAQRLGLDWNRTWLVSVEKAGKPLGAEQILALPLVLTSALGHKTVLADLLLGEESVLLGIASDNPPPIWAAAYLRDVVTGIPFRRPFGSSTIPAPSSVDEPSASARAATKLRTISRSGLGDVDVRALSLAEAGAGDVEEKLARRLGVPTITVVAAAASLWGRSLTEERDDQLADKHPRGAEAVSQSIRASVLRKLTAALAARVSEAAAKAAEESRAAAEAAEIAAAAEAAMADSESGEFPAIGDRI